MNIERDVIAQREVLRFSLKTLLIATTLIATVLGGFAYYQATVCQFRPR